MNFYQRKLYALLQAPNLPRGRDIASELKCLQSDLPQLRQWWETGNEQNQVNKGRLAQDIGSSCDRVNLSHIERTDNNTQPVTVHHPISGQQQQVTPLQLSQNTVDISQIKHETEAKTVFWWFWRFYPELLADQQHDALLFPAHTVIPDCPLHSHQSTVSALTGAMFPQTWQIGEPHQTPYLLVFTFSPVQEFIKSSRKFLDFWAGSYLLHYLSSRLCWHIAQHLGPDAIIIPSLWSQEIIDALLVKEYSDFAPYFICLQDGGTPVNRFTDKISTSLSTAGFPNAITVLVSGEAEAKQWGKCLKETLTKEWVKIGTQVKSHIRTQVIEFLDKQTPEELEKILKEVFPEFENTPAALEPYRRELQLLKRQCCWEWNKLWEAQLNYTWEPYWTAIPLGHPEKPLAINKNDGNFDSAWIDCQATIAQPLVDLPDTFENQFYTYFNVGNWWGSIQQRLKHCLNDVKYTRNWQISTAPGERSTISGQFSALHPQLNYQVTTTLTGKTRDLRQGSGVAAGSLRLFWFVMSKAYPGLFNGSEKLNALELTKRMAWVYGGVAESLGIDVQKIVKKIESPEQKGKKVFKIIEEKKIIYEQLLRFPNLSSIASARFIESNRELASKYWQNLNIAIKTNLPEYRRLFYFLTRCRYSQLPKTDAKINPDNRLEGNYNGVMFSSKWLIDDMSLQGEQANTLRNLVAQAHQDTGFGDSSPADWWVILLADGDGMGDYVSGKKLKKYRDYVEVNAVDKSTDFDENLFNEFLDETDKRMGPATHVGLNRALLDFSNRLVPYLTEKRFCGRVIYSGGDDVKVVLPLEDLPEYILSLRAAWCGGKDLDTETEFTNSFNGAGNEATGYWHPTNKVKGLPKRPHFTMGKNATMSAGVIIAHKSVPLPTVLENLWQAEAERAKKIPGKDGICFRVIYGGGNQLEALMKGELLESWWDWVEEYKSCKESLSPLLYRLAEELPRRASITENYYLFSKAARVIMDSRDNSKQLEPTFQKIEQWLDKWEDWAKSASKNNPEAIGNKPEDLAKLLRFTAFWVDKRVERLKWGEK